MLYIHEWLSSSVFLQEADMMTLADTSPVHDSSKVLAFSRSCVPTGQLANATMMSTNIYYHI